MTSFSRQFLHHAANACGLIGAERTHRVALDVAAARDEGSRPVLSGVVSGVDGGAGHAGRAAARHRPAADRAQKKNPDKR